MNIVITGASGGVGGMLARGLALKGHHIVCLGRDGDRLEKLVNKIKSQGGNATSQVADMEQEQEVIAAGTRIVSQCGRIDVWINNVGVNNHNAIGPTWKLEPKHWWTEVSLNLYTAFLGTHTAIKLMKEIGKGYIINLGGGGVQEPKPFGSAYGAAKTALVKFTETVNIELEQEGINIKIFAFNPGFIRNARTEKLVESVQARKYMPQLEQALTKGKMSNIADSLHLIETLISGKADKLGGKYFFSDDRNIVALIANSEGALDQQSNLLRVR